MRAVINATAYRPSVSPLTSKKGYPSVLLKIADQPILFYIIEFLADHHIYQIDILLRDNPNAVEEILGDGKRWGVAITYHLAQHEDKPFTPIFHSLENWDGEKVIIGVGDILPNITLKTFQIAENGSPIAIMSEPEKWSGWCIISPQIIKSMGRDITWNSFEEWVKIKSQKIETDTFISTQTPSELLNSNIKMMVNSNCNHILPSTAHLADNGIWLSRGVSLHPTVKLIPPLFIGEFCKIHQNVQLGPNAIIENHCIIDSGSCIEDSLICEKSYVGENLEVRKSIINFNLLLSIVHDTTVKIKDNFILSELSSKSLTDSVIHFLGKVAALFLFVLLSPIYLFLILTTNLKIKKAIHLPADEDSSQWDTIDYITFDSPHPYGFKNFFRKLPLLPLILKGSIHFVGVGPRTKEEVANLPCDWKKLYLKSKIGAITLAEIEYGKNASDDERYVCETYYSSQRTLKLDYKLLLRWLKAKEGRVE